jgi:hypothetical protein
MRKKMKNIWTIIILFVFVSFTYAQNDAITSQSGSTNISAIEQTGATNNSSVNQVGNMNNAALNQYGSLNKTIASQTGNEDASLVQQVGTSNYISIIQLANTSLSNVYQEGEANIGVIRQNGTGSAGPVVDEHAAIIQNGINNDAYIRQQTDLQHGGSNVSQTQEGTAQNARAWQYSWTSNITQQQSGPSTNWVMAFQYGENNLIVQSQIGSGNRASVDEQTGGGANEAYQFQIGNSNLCLIQQYDINGANTLPGSTGNFATVTQNGDENWAGEDYGTSRKVGIRQSGNDNIANIEQNLNVNKSYVLQTGESNLVNVSQLGGTGLLSTYGDYVNKASVNQTGNNNSSTTTQIFQ